MLKFVIVLTAFVGVFGAPTNEIEPQQLDGRIVGGNRTTISSYPWQVSIQRRGSQSCGGSVYSETIIVTAAHCIDESSFAIIKVRAGSSFWNSGGMISKLAAYKRHELYGTKNSAYDIALLRLVTPLKFSYTIKPIALATQPPPNGAPAIVSGWGTRASGSETLPTQLQAVNLKIVSMKECASDKYGYGNLVTESMICSYAESKDSCQGDSGGPMVSGGVLVGVVSWGAGCAAADSPGVYADVAYLREWVVTNAKTL